MYWPVSTSYHLLWNTISEQIILCRSMNIWTLENSKNETLAMLRKFSNCNQRKSDSAKHNIIHNKRKCKIEERCNFFRFIETFSNQASLKFAKVFALFSPSCTLTSTWSYDFYESLETIFFWWQKLLWMNSNCEIQQWKNKKYVKLSSNFFFFFFRELLKAQNNKTKMFKMIWIMLKLIHFNLLYYFLKVLQTLWIKN